MPETQSRKLAAILAADIAGYSALMGADEARTVRDLKGHQAVVLPMIGECGGRIIDTAGDGILAEFASVVNALECAVAIQAKMAERNTTIEPERRMQFRIGINIGDVIYDEARIYGDGINIAARLEGIAEPGGIYVSRQAYDHVEGKVALSFRRLGPQTLKNIVKPVEVFAVGHAGTKKLRAMADLFLSHSSQDDAHASALEAWLRANGISDVFIDHHSIAGGEKWLEALRASASACRVVVCLVTRNWLGSHKCFSEFGAAWYMGKRIVPLFLLPSTPQLDDESKQRLAKVRAEDDGVDIARCVGANGVLDLDADQEAASRLKTGLRAAGAISGVGLDPEAFAIDAKLRETPFPGLASFGDDDADAALFYGRSRDIANTIEILRSMRALSEKRPLVILGASGAGKSSLLKAGIIPRLRREAAWLPLRAFRPGADPLLNFAEALSRTLADFGKREAHGLIRDRLLDVSSKAERDKGELTAAGLATLEAALEAEGKTLREAAGRATASILISVDQAEEMARSDGKSGEALADYLRVALAATQSSWQLAFTIRTDSFPELQSHRRFQDLQARGYDLRAIPVFRFDSVVEQPAKRYGVEIDPQLVDALMEDAPKEDALPLLAFALQRLWRQYAASGVLTNDNYDKVGGLNGLIEDAAERALSGREPEQDVPAVAPPQRLVDLGVSTFVPALVQINDQGATIRRVAQWASFNDEQQELLGRFDRWRLVVRKSTEADGGTVEVAHEALFREWTRLKSWLEPERARLEALRGLQLTAATWERQGRTAAFLDHRDKRLAEASELGENERYKLRLTALDLDYVAACREAARLARRRMRRMQAVVGALAFGVVAGLIGWLNQAYLLERLNWFMTMRPYMLANVRPFVLTPEAERALKPQATFRECAKDCPEMIVVPAGEFMMGSADAVADRYPWMNDERPQHRVTIARPFAVSKFDVTFAEWDACVSVGGCPQVSDGGMRRGTKPVINVNWHDAQQYAAWLSTMTGRSYRLLSEAEWEYAARAGTTTEYPWGDDIGKGNANCNSCGSQWDGKQTSPVGSFQPNAFGLYDMHGNVFQWVEDCYQPPGYHNGPPTDGSARNTGGDCSRRVVRSGAWSFSPRFLRSAKRNGFAPSGRADSLGFRLARTLNGLNATSDPQPKRELPPLATKPTLAKPLAAKYGTAQEAKAMLERAIPLVRADPAAAFTTFNRGEDGFKDRDLYVFCVSAIDGKMNAGPPRLIGMDMRTFKDSTGKAFGQEIYSATEGSIAEVSYLSFRQGSDVEIRKISFVTRIGANICGVGYYQ